MENKKYELVEDDFIIHNGRKLYRIKALKKLKKSHVFGSFIVQKGEIGGYVEGYHNLGVNAGYMVMLKFTVMPE
jgi:hypothetical protein